MSLRKTNENKSKPQSREEASQTPSQDHQISSQLKEITLNGSEGVQEMKSLAIHHYGEDWAQFFVQWAIRAEQQHLQTVARLQDVQDEVQAQSRNVILTYQQENDLLKNQLQELKGSLTYLQERELEKEVREGKTLLRKQRFAARERRPLRDAATLPEFECALQVVEGMDYHQNFARSRDIVSLLILYSTGIRISNLLLCTVNNLQALLNGGLFSIPSIKTTYNRELRIPVTRAVQELAIRNRKHIERVCQEKDGNDKVITSQGMAKPLARSALDTRINRILKHVAKTTNKNITSHSFRIGQVTNMIQVAGLPQAQQLIGHRDIRTTILYDRGTMSKRTVDQIYNDVEANKQSKVPRKRNRK